MGVSRWGGPESREYPAFSMATQPIRQPLTTKETDLPCVAYIFTLFCFSFFFSPFISFYPSILSTVETSNPLFILPSFVSPSLSPSFFSFRSYSKRGGGKGETIPLLSNIVDLTFRAQNSFSHACYTNLCLYIYICVTVCVYT